MSVTSDFLKRHLALIADIQAKYSEYVIAKSETELAMGNFPAIGLFLGSSQHSKESIKYAPIQYSYILCVFDAYDMDSPTDLLVKQQAMFDLMEEIIAKMDYNVLTDLEPAVSIGIDAGTFITGWTTTITFN